jgi:hypothetical protein
MSRKLFPNPVAAEVTRLKHQEDQSLITSAATLAKRAFVWLIEILIPRPPRFAKYRPAPRLGTRRIESRLLRRLAWTTAETAQ